MGYQYLSYRKADISSPIRIFSRRERYIRKTPDLQRNGSLSKLTVASSLTQCPNYIGVLGNMARSKVLIVDDYEPFRLFVCSTLQRYSEFQTIEAQDGEEAIQKIEEARPDIVLFDIGLPKLNGLDAARRALQLRFPPRILFLSQESSPDIVEEAFRLGALGYVHKMQARDELLLAVEAVLRGERFLSSGQCSRRDFTKNTNSPTITRAPSAVARQQEGAPTDSGQIPLASRESVCHGNNMESSIKYPWQQAVLDAFLEISSRLRDKISVAETIISSRIAEVPADQDEQVALRDALRALQTLVKETHKSKKTSTA